MLKGGFDSRFDDCQAWAESKDLPAMSGLRVRDLLLAGFGRVPPTEPPRPETALFDREFYAASYPHVVKGGIDLFVHYSHCGCWNGYDPNAYFDSDWYLKQNADVAATGANPLDHYVDRGALEGRDPSPAFSSWLYLMFYPDVRSSGMNPLLHYLQCGKAEGRIAPPSRLIAGVSVMRDVAPTEVPQTDEARRAIDLLSQWTRRLLAETTLTA